MTDGYLINRLLLRYAARRPWLNLGDRFGSCLLPRLVAFYALRRCCGGARRLRACRLVGCSSGNRRSPISTVRSRASPTHLTRGHNIPTRRPSDAGADPRRSEDPQSLHPHHPHLYVDWRRRTRAGDRRRVRAEGHARHLDRQERSSQRARNPGRHRARPSLQQRQRDRGRQRDDAAGGQDDRRAHQHHSARQAREPGPGDHR